MVQLDTLHMLEVLRLILIRSGVKKPEFYSYKWELAGFGWNKTAET